MSILLRRCTTQFLVLDRGLEEEEPEPGVVDEMEDLDGKEKKTARNVHTVNLIFCWLAGNVKCVVNRYVIWQA